MAHSDKSECAICTGNSYGVIQQALINYFREIY
jgi:hypothetical protein